ncbi:MAG TPA: alpha-L-rhamnosidase C-terminal domain-containing protein [Chthonomonadaceae bacterium]|nr:alpha-L-rhamnosidase C-terminal domain-containing protein [Chthonomonadaceae bacterium]
MIAAISFLPSVRQRRAMGLLSLCLRVVLAGCALGGPALSLRADEPPRPMPPTLDPTYSIPLPKHTPKPAQTGPDAQWIWADSTADNQTVYLRGTISIPRKPESAALYVTADNFYTLFINGQQVDETRSDPKDDFVWSHVHRLDVTRYLAPGKNVIALRATNAGGPAGAIARLELDGKPALLTGANWKVSTEAPPADWTAPTFDDSAWKPATVLAPVTGGPWSSQLQGWPGYLASAPPYLAHLPMRPVEVLDLHEGAGKLEGTETLTRPETARLAVHLAPSGSSDPPSLVLDFGKELSGRIEITAEGPATVLVGTGESREEAINAPWGGVHRLELANGSKAATPYSAFRYAKLTFVPGPGAQQTQAITSVLCDHLYYPVQYKGAFACSDNLLTRIWYTGAYTAHLCMQDDIWDAPKRDRARWMGDLHVSGEVINNVFADTFLMEQTMRRLREDAQGGQPAAESPRAHVNGIPGYSCAWIAGLADFHRHIGDYDYLNKQHDLLISMLEYLRGELDNRGVFANKRGAWPFVDWSPDFNGDSPLARAATHLFLVKAVREAVFLLNEMGDPANASKYAAWASELTEAAQQYLADPNTHTFSDRRQENAMAIYSGVATPEQTRAIYDTVLKPGSPAWNIVATPYYNNYVIFAMSMAGHTAETLQVLRDYWGGMLAEGATTFWEGYDPRWEKNNFHAHLQADNGTGYFVSLCHGWSAGPTNWLTERVLGVRPTGGGFTKAEIVPELGDLTWAEGDVPTPRGILHVRAEKTGASMTLHLTLPRGVTALVGLPGQTLTINGRPAALDHTAAGRAYASIGGAGKYTIVGQ